MFVVGWRHQAKAREARRRRRRQQRAKVCLSRMRASCTLVVVQAAILSIVVVVVVVRLVFSMALVVCACCHRAEGACCARVCVVCVVCVLPLSQWPHLLAIKHSHTERTTRSKWRPSRAAAACGNRATTKTRAREITRPLPLPLLHQASSFAAAACFLRLHCWLLA